MSSDTTSALEVVLKNLQLNDYLTLTLLSAVGYDYILTFPNEVEYIWTKCWTWVSTLFILVRYAGLYAFIMSCCNLAQKPEVVSHLVWKSCVYPSCSRLELHRDNVVIDIDPEFQRRQCEVMQISTQLASLLFLGAAEFTMVLRVWAMYYRSRLILSILLVSFSLEMISVILVAAVATDPNNWTMSIVMILNTPVCTQSWKFPVFTMVSGILQTIHGGIVSGFAIAQFVRQSLQVYHATKQWRIDRYMNLLAKEGTLYFIAILLLNTFTTLLLFRAGRWYILLTILQLVPAFTLSPRFILSIREMYARDIQSKYSDGIDTGFGLSSGASGSDTVTAMVFADVEQNEVTESIEEIPRLDGETEDIERILLGRGPAQAE